MRNWFKKFYIKWIMGECPHFCFMCEYRNICDANYEEDSWSKLFKYKKER